MVSSQSSNSDFTSCRWVVVVAWFSYTCPIPSREFSCTKPSQGASDRISPKAYRTYLLDFAAFFPLPPAAPANPTPIKKHNLIAAPTYTNPKFPQYISFHSQTL